MSVTRALLCLTAIFALTGCATIKKWLKVPVVKDGDAVAVGAAVVGADAATTKSDAAVKAVEEKAKAIGSSVRANVQNSREENKLQPDGPHTVFIEKELGLADKTLSSVPVDPIELALGQARREANLLGQRETFEKLYEQSSTKSDTLVKDLGSALTARDEAIKERDAARVKEKTAITQFQETVERNAAEFKKKWDDEQIRRDKNEQEWKNGIAAKTQLWLTMGCYGLGVGCFLYAAIRSYMVFQTGGLGLTGIVKSVGLAVLCGACFFALGKLTSQPWFWWACGTVLALACVSFIAVLVVDAHKTKNEMVEKKEMQECTDDVIAGVDELRSTSKNPPMSMILAMQQEMGGGTTVEQATVAIKAALRTVIDPTMRQWVTEGDGVAKYVDERRRAMELVNPTPVPKV